MGASLGRWGCSWDLLGDCWGLEPSDRALGITPWWPWLFPRRAEGQHMAHAGQLIHTFLQYFGVFKLIIVFILQSLSRTLWHFFTVLFHHHVPRAVRGDDLLRFGWRLRGLGWCECWRSVMNSSCSLRTGWDLLCLALHKCWANRALPKESVTKTDCWHGEFGSWLGVWKPERCVKVSPGSTFGEDGLV